MMMTSNKNEIVVNKKGGVLWKKIDCLKVIEVWQGHLDNGAGFSKAISSLETLFKNEK